MHLLQLPVELHLHIATFLLQGTLSKLCTVNRRLREIYNKPLYTTECRLALSWASRVGSVKTAQLALQYGAEANGESDATRTPLDIAARNGHVPILQLLLESGADPTKTGFDDKAPLSVAAEAGHLAAVELLLQEGAEREVKKEACNIAIIKDSIDVVKAILDDRDGIEITSACRNGLAPFETACRYGRLDILNLFLEYDPEVCKRCRNISNDFYLAAYSGRFQILTRLFECHPAIDLDAKNYPVGLEGSGWTSLAGAACNGYLEIVGYLIEQGADVNGVCPGGWSPLLIAATNDKMAVCSALIDGGADINYADERGRTPLYRAIEGGYSDIVKLLLERGANASAFPVKRKETPLHWACVNGGPADVIDMLLDYGADPLALNDEGKTSIDVAARSRWPKLVDLLKAKRRSTTARGGGILSNIRGLSMKFTELLTAKSKASN